MKRSELSEHSQNKTPQDGIEKMQRKYVRYFQACFFYDKLLPSLYENLKQASMMVGKRPDGVNSPVFGFNGKWGSKAKPKVMIDPFLKRLYKPIQQNGACLEPLEFQDVVKLEGLLRQYVDEAVYQRVHVLGIR